MKVVLYILLLVAASVTGYELWSQHVALTFLEGRVNTLSEQQKTLGEQQTLIFKNQRTISRNEKTLNRVQQDIIEALKFVMKAVAPDANGKQEQS